MLIGLPGSGKTTVAERVAAALRAPWCDLDARVAAAAGCSIGELFASRGEAAFRELERRAMHDALAASPQVIATGGGWAAQSGNLEAAHGRALVVYLAVTPAVAAARLAGVTDRPLLGGDPAEMERRIAGLLAAREAWYRRAGVEVPAAAVASDVAALVVAAARREGGW